MLFGSETVSIRKPKHIVTLFLEAINEDCFMTDHCDPIVQRE